jgi:hypothetical protein
LKSRTKIAGSGSVQKIHRSKTLGKNNLFFFLPEGNAKKSIPFCLIKGRQYFYTSGKEQVSSSAQFLFKMILYDTE